MNSPPDCTNCPMLKAERADAEFAEARSEGIAIHARNEIDWYKQRIEELEIELQNKIAELKVTHDWIDQQ